MKSNRSLANFRKWTLGLAAACLITPQCVVAANPANSPTRPQAAQERQSVGDVALQQGNLFVGQVVNRSGVAQGQTAITLRQGDKVIAAGKTDAKGRFVIRPVPAGVYQLQTANSTTHYRLWAPKTAPPAARPSVLVVDDAVTALGQGEGGASTADLLIIGGGLTTGAVIFAVQENAS